MFLYNRRAWHFPQYNTLFKDVQKKWMCTAFEVLYKHLTREAIPFRRPNSRSDIQEIRGLWWNPKGSSCVHRILLLELILSQQYPYSPSHPISLIPTVKLISIQTLSPERSFPTGFSWPRFCLQLSPHACMLHSLSFALSCINKTYYKFQYQDLL